ncbi:MAG: endonuclease/exonuclease/phosphatase family protein [Acidobacteria bacterium]|nr:endonuclease/exonuclease/phosphatase family protein [Acidobacteriota bacterium]
MNTKIGSLRVATYNIHKCKGLDRRIRPERIVAVLRGIDADIIALQEVLSFESGLRHENQARFIAEELGFYSAFGHTCHMRGGRYGNLLLTRFPIDISHNYDISSPRRREPRGCLRADVQLKTTMLHVFNLHLGTGYVERRYQAKRLLKESIFERHVLRGPRIVLGDFNEWTRGAVSKFLASNFSAADLRKHLNRSKTYPGVLPFLHLDHIYFDPVLRLERLTLCRDRTALIASDHLPLVADFSIESVSA